MKKVFKVRMLFLFLTLLLAACNNSSKKSEAEGRKSFEKQTADIKILCFQNVIPFKNDSSKKDIQELKLTIQGKEVTGEYNWLPAEKDKRKGTLKGTISNNLIDAIYTFMQEGKKNTASIQIKVGNNKAEIMGGNPALGLDTSLEKVNCKE